MPQLKDKYSVQKYEYIFNKGNNKNTEHRAIFQRERQNSYVNKQTGFVTRRILLVEQELVTFLEHLSSSRLLGGFVLLDFYFHVYVL
jgi:hypothetical protein